MFNLEILEAIVFFTGIQTNNPLNLTTSSEPQNSVKIKTILNIRLLFGISH